MKFAKTMAILLAMMLCFACMTGAAVSAAGEPTVSDWTDPTNTAYHTVLLAPQTYGNTTVQPETAYDEALYTTGGIPQLQGCYFQEPSGNVYWSTTMSSKPGYCRPTQTKMGHEGKYVVQYRMKAKALTGGAKPVVSTFVSHGGTWAGANYFGFVVRPVAAYLAQKNVGFAYRSASPAAEVEVTLGDDTQMVYTDDVWYTIRDTYDLDASPFVATREIFNAQGTLVKTFSTKVSNASVAIDESKDLSFDCVRVDLNAASGTVGIDDLTVAKVTAVPISVSYDESKISVSLNGTPVPNGTQVPVPYNSADSTVFTVSAKSGCEIDRILVNGEEADQASFASVTEPQTLEVIPVYASDDPENADYFTTVLSKQAYGNTNTAPETVGDENSISADVQGGYLQEANGNVYWATVQYAGSRYFSGYCRPAQTLLGTSGEYTIQYKMKAKSLTGGATPTVSTTIDHNNTWGGANYFGFTARPLAAYLAQKNAGFVYRSASPAAETEDTLSDDTKVTFVDNTWYVVRDTYNLDLSPMTATREIFDPQGNLVNSFTNEVSNASVTIDENKNLYFDCVRVDVNKAGGGIGVDDLMIAKTTHKPATVTYDATMGSVNLGNETIVSGKEFAVPYNTADEQTIEITPAEGYAIDTVTVNGQTVEGSSVVLQNVMTAQDITVTFKEVGPDVSVGNLNSFEVQKANLSGNTYVKATGDSFDYYAMRFLFAVNVGETAEFSDVENYGAYMIPWDVLNGGQIESSSARRSFYDAAEYPIKAQSTIFSADLLGIPKAAAGRTLYVAPFINGTANLEEAYSEEITE